MAASDPEPASKATRPVSTRGERRRHLWSVIVSVLVCVELFFDGFPESPDAGSWGETRRPLLMVGVGVLALLVTGAVQAKWARREGRGSSSAGHGDSWSIPPGSLLRPPASGSLDWGCLSTPPTGLSARADRFMSSSGGWPWFC